MKQVLVSNFLYWHILSLSHENSLLKIYIIKQYTKLNFQHIELLLTKINIQFIQGSHGVTYFLSTWAFYSCTLNWIFVPRILCMLDLLYCNLKFSKFVNYNIYNYTIINVKKLYKPCEPLLEYIRQINNVYYIFLLMNKFWFCSPSLIRLILE